MDVFNALWDNSEQRKRPNDEDFSMFSMEDWLSMSSTHKILLGSLNSPLPPELDLPEPSANARSGTHMQNSPVVRGGNTQSQPPFHLATHADAESRKSNILKQEYIPGLLKFPNLPKISSIIAEQQRDCFKLFFKFRGKSLQGLTPEEKAEYQLFQSLYSRIQEEQKEFLEYAKNCWHEFVERTWRIKPDPHNFFLQCWQDKVSRVMSQYSKRYKRAGKISLDYKLRGPIDINFMKNILNIGRVPCTDLPDLKSRFVVPTTMRRLRQWKLLNLPSVNSDGTLHRVPVSRDPNAERLARLHGANVVISSSGFKCLLDNHDERRHPHPNGVGRSWILPIIIKEHRTFCDGKPVMKTVVFVDKPFPLSKMTGYEKVTWFHKQALHAVLVDRLKEGMIFDVEGKDYMVEAEISQNSHQEISQSETKLATGASIASSSIAPTSSFTNCPEKELQVSNLTVTSPSPVFSGSNHRDTGTDDDESEDDSAMQIVLSDSEMQDQQKEATPSSFEGLTKIMTLKSNTDQDCIATPAKAVKSPCVKMDQDQAVDGKGKKPLDLEKDKAVEHEERNSAHNSQLETRRSVQGSIHHSYWENLPSPPSVKIIKGNALPLSLTNVTYNLWLLQQRGSSADRVSNKAQGINLLVRSHFDSCEEQKSESKKHQPLILAAKPEYQLEYAAGTTPLSDLTRQWAKLSIQPDARLTRVRINASNCEVVSIEKRTKEEVEAEAKALYQEDLGDTLCTLYGVVEELLKLPKGEYLLAHSPEMGMYADLLGKAEADQTTDLYLPSIYEARPQVSEGNVPWQPLDPLAILPRHIFLERLPCTLHSKWLFSNVVPKKAKPPVVKKVTPKRKNKKKRNAKSKGAKNQSQS